MELKLGKGVYEKRDIADRRFEIENSGTAQLTIEEATVLLLWAVDGDKIKVMLHGSINENVIYAMLCTFGKNYPDMVRQATIRYLAECMCIFPSGESVAEKAETADPVSDRFSQVPSLKGGDGECKS